MQKIVNGTLTQYQTTNSKQKNTLLVLHGWGQSGSNWQTIANLLPKNYQIVLLDLPGFGGTEHLPDNPSIPEYTQFVFEFIKKLNLKKPAILGHSFGGQIAINLTAKYPTLLFQLILLSPAGIRNRSKKQKLKTRVYKKFKFIKKILPKSIIQLILKQLTSTDYLNASSQHKQILKQIVIQDLTNKLNKITTPTTILWGSEDKEIPYSGKIMANLIPNSKLIVLYGQDHNPHLNKPQDLAQAINQNLK
ncbi:alpha/beta hydrolase [Patescibacteria group bacterium]|nr:alpha/beta hydrolase [Patescibacteria group bacterium]